MYYPYLRAKRFELLAIREFAVAYSKNKNVFPIIEPVNGSFDELSKALSVAIDNKLGCAVILNPNVGQTYKNENFSSCITQIGEGIGTLLRESNCIVPAFIIDYGCDYHEIIECIREHNLHSAFLICKNVKNIDDESFVALISLEQVRVSVIDGENRALKKKLKGVGKEIVKIKDGFIAKARNRDYLETEDELFSEDFAYYKDDGYNGFSDYTTIGDNYYEGGGLPYVIAIHLTYQKENQIWIRHFVSETNADNNSNIQGKFYEAAAKALRFIAENDIQNEACEELKDYADKEHYPGLGTIKKISIKNHLELMEEVLSHL